MKIKDHTVQVTFHPVLTALLFGIDHAYQECGGEVIITCGNESSAKHSYTSLHYATPGQAADIRSWEWTYNGLVYNTKRQADIINSVVNLYCDHMNIPYDWFDIILEDKGKPNEHWQTLRS